VLTFFLWLVIIFHMDLAFLPTYGIVHLVFQVHFQFWFQVSSQHCYHPGILTLILQTFLQLLLRSCRVLIRAQRRRMYPPWFHLPCLHWTQVSIQLAFLRWCLQLDLQVSRVRFLRLCPHMPHLLYQVLYLVVSRA
jgi:hypothetical protein